MLIDDVIEVTNDAATLKVHNPLTENRNIEFEERYKSLVGKVSTLYLDMSELKTIDMSGIGRLILLRKHFCSDIDIHITHCHHRLRKLLYSWELEKMFHIKPV